MVAQITSRDRFWGEVAMTIADTAMDVLSSGTRLRRLWIELTSRCNLACVPCYAESGPEVRDDHPLSTSQYLALLDAAAEAGCPAVQFIGGEPTLYRDLPLLLSHSRTCGFSDVEIFTNAAHISDELLASIVANDVRIATSFYSDDPDIHDAITTRPGSHTLTVKTIGRLLDAGVDLRVAIISMASNDARIVETERFVRALGVVHTTVRAVQGIGRAAGEVVPIMDPMAELCGACAEGLACVSPEGVVTPCVMARAWPVGSLRDTALREILDSAELTDVRIAAATRPPRWSGPEGPEGPGQGDPDEEEIIGPGPTHCNPDITRSPRDWCSPKDCAPGKPGCLPLKLFPEYTA